MEEAGDGGEWRSASFDEKLSFEKEGQKAKIRVFSSVHQREAFDLVFYRWKSNERRDQGGGQAQAYVWHDSRIYGGLNPKQVESSSR
jgi:hypothetical protein